MLAITKFLLASLSLTLVSAVAPLNHIERSRIVDCGARGREIFELIQEYLANDLDKLLGQGKTQGLIDFTKASHDVDLRDEDDIKRIACQVVKVTEMTNFELPHTMTDIQQKTLKRKVFIMKIVVQFLDAVGLDNFERYKEKGIRVIAGVKKILASSSKIIAEIRAIQSEYGNDVLDQLIEPYNKVLASIGQGRIGLDGLKMLSAEQLAAVLATTSTVAEFATKTGLKVKDVEKMASILSEIRSMTDEQLEVVKKLTPLEQRSAKLLSDMGVLEFIRNVSIN